MDTWTVIYRLRGLKEWRERTFQTKQAAEDFIDWLQNIPKILKYQVGIE